ncbi:unnamed protein product [Mytilus coruscus]|uniref:Uncharacterized protein n=1 Tax=Mytilus coruscus TaxID=42192 RepID=A0A6J8D3L1_MYTCO|nr:unnamed protein product [Mytilus coruscus]
MLGQNDSEIWQCLPDTLISDFETLNLNARKDFLTNLVKHLSSEELSELMFTIGKDQEECLKDDIENISQHKSSPSGTYSTLQKWIFKSETTAPPCPPGVIIVAFDNEQVVAYKRGMSPNQKSRSYVITSIIYAATNSEDNMQTFIQTQDEIKPKNWFKLSHFDEKLKLAETKDQKLFLRGINGNKGSIQQ